MARSDTKEQFQRRHRRAGHDHEIGDQYLRKLLVVGMTSRAIQVNVRQDKGDLWLSQLLE